MSTISYIHFSNYLIAQTSQNPSGKKYFSIDSQNQLGLTEDGNKRASLRKLCSKVKNILSSKDLLNPVNITAIQKSLEQLKKGYETHFSQSVMGKLPCRIGYFIKAILEMIGFYQGRKIEKLIKAIKKKGGVIFTSKEMEAHQKEMGFSPLPRPPLCKDEPQFDDRNSKLRFRRCDDSRRPQLEKGVKSLDDGPFKDTLTENLNSCSDLEICNLTYPIIASPDQAALQHLATMYYNKYHILIRETLVEDLSLLIDDLSEEIDGPQLVGIVVAADEGHTHSLPLICFFGPKGTDLTKRKVEFLVADAIGSDGELVRQVYSKLELLSNASIYTSTKRRQVDTCSCRTGALELLKHSLLALYQDPGCTEGIAEFLKRNGKISDKSPFLLLELPASFDLTEQVTNKTADSNIPVIRDIFSSHLSKRKKQRTVAEYRRQYKEQVEFEYRAIFTYSNLKTDIKLPEGAAITGPYGIDKHLIDVTFKTSVQVNTYLAKKGLALQKKVAGSKTILS